MCSTFRPALLFVPLFLTIPCAAQLSITWQQLADLPYAVQSPYMFAVDGRIFVGDGITEDPPLALAGGMHEYLPATDTWVTRTPCPGPDRYGARGFSLNGLGYITCGWANNSPVIQVNDTWAYEPSSDSWTPKAPFPGGARYTAISCATSTKGYTGLGYSPYYDDWWEYDPAADQWTQRASFPGGARQSAISFVIDEQVYVGCGASSNTTFLSDLWRYDPQSDTWTPRAGLPTSRYASYAFTYAQQGFVVCGLALDTNNTPTTTAEVWTYDPATDSWTQLADLPGTPRGDGASCSAGGMGYLGFGRYTFGQVPLSANMTSEFWRIRQAETGIEEEGADPLLEVRTLDGTILITQTGATPVDVTITDTTGRLVGSGTVPPKGALAMRMDDRSPGIYLVRPASGDAQRVMVR